MLNFNSVRHLYSHSCKSDLTAFDVKTISIHGIMNTDLIKACSSFAGAFIHSR